jgi:hypothetical protein
MSGGRGQRIEIFKTLRKRRHYWRHNAERNWSSTVVYLVADGMVRVTLSAILTRP